MPFIQNNPLPPNKTYSLNLQSFSGGLNNRNDLLNQDEASDLLNVNFYGDTLMQKRFGLVTVDEFVLDGSVSYVGRYEPYNAASVLMRASKGKLYAGTASVANISGDISAVNYMGKFIFADGESLFQYGTFPQSSSTHVMVIGTPVSTAVVMQVTNAGNDYTPLSDTYVTGVQVYDYSNNKIWYEPCENEVSDTYKGASSTPLSPSFVEVHKDRLYVASKDEDKNTVYISDLSNENYFPVYLPLQMPPNSDHITGIKSFHDSIVVGRQRDLHAIYGNTNRTTLSNSLFQLVQITSHTGFINSTSFDEAHNHLLFIGYDGNAYALNSTKSDVEMLSTQVINRAVDFSMSPFSQSPTDLSKATSIFFDDEWHVSFNGVTAIYNYRLLAWTLHKYADVSATSYYIDDYVLNIGLDNGNIVKSSTQYLDLGKPYKALWASKKLDMGDPAIYKQIREVYIIAYTFNGFSSDVNIKLEIDYVDVRESFVIPNQSSVWGTSHFGDRFITRDINASLPIVIGRRGRVIRMVIENGNFSSGIVTNVDGLNDVANVVNGMLIYVTSEGAYYLYEDTIWTEQEDVDINQPMRVIEVSAQYELRGRR